VPHEHNLRINGADVAVWEWRGERPAVLLCHATGMHSRSWDQVIAQLADRQVFAIDFRGHGHSSKTPPYHWRTFGEDAAELAQALGLRGALGVGHSMGGYAVTLAAAKHPAAFGALLLVDPVIRPKEQYTGPWKAAQFVARRRDRWSSPHEMFESFQDRMPFATWDRQVLRDYCEYGLIPNGAGFRLACPPAVEAEIYELGALPEADISAEVAQVQIPVQIVRAPRVNDPTQVMRGSPTDPTLASRFKNAKDLYLPDNSHFIPMESPVLVANLIRA
jgi:lipase